MALQVATGFQVAPTPPILFNSPPPEGMLTQADIPALLNKPAVWLSQIMQTEPFELPEQSLSVDVIGRTAAEFLVSIAVLAFRVKADTVRPVSAMHRIILVDYMPWQQSDPPVPLLNLLNLPRRALALHNEAVRLFLRRHDASAIRSAMSIVLQDSVTVGMHRAEAFYYVAKMLSLVTGSYTQV